MGEAQLRRETRYDPEIQTDDDRRLADSNGRLFRRLKRMLHGQIMTQQLYDQTRDLVETHVTTARQHGVRFPDLAVVYLTGCRAVEIVRADMEPTDIQQWCLNLTVRYPQVTAREIAEALARHFPAYAGRVHAAARREALPRVEFVGGAQETT